MYFFKKNEEAPRKNVAGFIVLLIVSFLLFGCSTGDNEEGNGAEAKESVDKNEQAIRAVIEEEFNGPDEEYKEVLNAAMEAQVSEEYMDDYEAYLESPEYQAFMNYMEETYASYFTENGYEHFINSTPAFMYSGFEQEYELTPSAIEITQNEAEETLYDISFQVAYTDGNGESSDYHFEGSATVPEEGKIGKIEYLDGYEDGLHQALTNNE